LSRRFFVLLPLLDSQMRQNVFLDEQLAVARELAQARRLLHRPRYRADGERSLPEFALLALLSAQLARAGVPLIGRKFQQLLADFLGEAIQPLPFAHFLDEPKSFGPFLRLFDLKPIVLRQFFQPSTVTLNRFPQ